MSDTVARGIAVGTAKALIVHQTKKSTEAQLGHIIVDGITVVVNSEGVLSSLLGVTVDAVGLLANLGDYDNELKGFSYFATDSGELYLKQSDAPGDWSPALPFRGPEGPPGPPKTFVEMTDTPNSYVGQTGKATTVNIDENALEFTDIETPTGAQVKVNTHAVLTAPHSATSAATPDRLMLRDANGRAQVVAPAAAADIARKDTVDVAEAAANAYTNGEIADLAGVGRTTETVKGNADNLGTHEGGKATTTILGHAMVDGTTITAVDGVISAPGSGVSTFIELTDTPAGYTGQAGKAATVTALEGGLEFTTVETPTGAQAKVDAHANLTNNPHATTATHVGLGNVDNVKQAPLVLSINEQTGASYTLVLTDGNGKLIDMNRATAQTLTVPTNASVAFAVGTQILIRQKGAGQVTIAPAGGVTLNLTNSENKTRKQNSVAGLIKLATDTWVACGDLGA